MKEFEKWFKKAENDLLVITNNLASQQVPIDPCCFHAQQAAEKYLKAYLISRNNSFPKTHDLQVLINLGKQTNSSFDMIEDAAIRLSDYSIASRYPDTFDDLTIDDVKIALKDSLIIKDFILKHFFD